MQKHLGKVEGYEAPPNVLPAELTLCDAEPIHVPGSIQPHGLLLIADESSLTVVAGAGDIEGRLAPAWLGRPLGELIGQDAGEFLRKFASSGSPVGAEPVRGISELFDVSPHRTGRSVLVELEPVEEQPSAATLAWLDGATAIFDRATDLRSLCERAAIAFRNLTGFDRVMIYRFLDDEAGTVLAEDRDPRLGAFLNHHFPAADIPKQARALYVRNRVRVIPDVSYQASPIRPASSGLIGIDLSDAALRSVSPIHIQYLKNMGVGASASISIVKDGLLWGLIACHHATPRRISFDSRAAARALAGALARQIRAREDAATYRDRLRLAGAGDTIVARLGSDDEIDAAFGGIRDDLRALLDASGLAIVQRGQVRTSGTCPPAADLVELARFVERQSSSELYATHQLSAAFAPAAAYQAVASGMLGFTLSTEEPVVLMWFRAEAIEIVNWAGNPHKEASTDPHAILTPRASFEAWSETVRAKARPWTLGEVEAATRLRRALVEWRQTRRLRDLNRELGAMVAEKEALLRQKDFLIREVNHRVQNSLQLVSSFLGLQGKAANDPILTGHLADAQRRLSAVALVHRRLYRNDQVEAIDLARYLEELCAEMVSSMGAEWANAVRLDLDPVLISTDRAVNVGLILTELVINANKYAYGGGPGPIAIRLEQHLNRFRLSVADDGIGGHKPGQGFGTRMMRAMVEQLAGTIDYVEHEPGLRVIVSAPVEDRRTG